MAVDQDEEDKRCPRNQLRAEKNAEGAESQFATYPRPVVAVSSSRTSPAMLNNHISDSPGPDQPANEHSNAQDVAGSKAIHKMKDSGEEYARSSRNQPVAARSTEDFKPQYATYLRAVVAVSSSRTSHGLPDNHFGNPSRQDQLTKENDNAERVAGLEAVTMTTDPGEEDQRSARIQSVAAKKS